MNQSHSVNKALCQTPSPLFAVTFLSPQVCVNLSPCRESFSNRGQMDVGVLQAGDPATVTNLTNTDTRGGSDNTRCHQVKVLQHRAPQPITREQRELDGFISPPPPPPAPPPPTPLSLNICLFLTIQRGLKRHGAGPAHMKQPRREALSGLDRYLTLGPLPLPTNPQGPEHILTSPLPISFPHY